MLVEDLPTHSSMSTKLALCIGTLLVAVIIISTLIFATQIHHSPNPYNGDDKHEDESRKGLWSEETKNEKNEMKRSSTVEIAGSRLPDCKHACGSCWPCRLVMVSLACATQTNSETCPISYKCICNGKSHPVP